MIYVDTSVVLAQLLAEDRRPRATLWNEPLVSSRLVEYETWVRLNALELTRTHGDAARDLVSRIALVELSPLVLERALEPFPGAVRTLDALHLASLQYLRSQRLEVSLATYDERMAHVAGLLNVPVETP